MRPSHRPSIALLAALALLAAACASGAEAPSAMPGSPPPAAGPTEPSMAPSDAPTDVPTAPSSGPPTDAPTSTPGASGPSESPSGPAWQRLEVADGPAPRSDHTLTAGPDGHAYLFGGRGEDGALGDLWRLDLGTAAWERLEPAGDVPAARFGHVAVWAEGVGLVIWSGQRGTDFFRDLWAFDPDDGVWSQLPDGGDPPEARYGSCGAIGPDGRLWVSHGFTATGRFDDTRAYDLAAGSWERVELAGELPVERCLHDCLWGPDGRLLLYAGQTNAAPALGDLWALDPSDGAWGRQEPAGAPPARQLYALGQTDGAAWVFGGVGDDGKPRSDAFRLDLATLAWEPVAAGSGPGARSGATFVADPERGRLLLFGGVTREGPLAELWALTADG